MRRVQLLLSWLYMKGMGKYKHAVGDFGRAGGETGIS
jgi:hypothetical protein